MFTIKCPKCLQEIDRFDSMNIRYQPFHLDEQDQPVYDVVPSNYPWEPSHQYFCPKCGETLAMDEAEAIRILKASKLLNIQQL